MSSVRTIVVAAIVLALATLHATSQTAAPAPTPPPAPGSIATHAAWPTAKPADVHSVQAIVDAVYDVTSGPKGQQRDWDRMRSLFLPDSRLIPIRHLPPAAAGAASPPTPTPCPSQSTATSTVPTRV